MRASLGSLAVVVSMIMSPVSVLAEPVPRPAPPPEGDEPGDATPEREPNEHPARAQRESDAATQAASDHEAIKLLQAQLEALRRREAEREAASTAANEDQKKALRRAVSFSAAPGRGMTLTVGDDRFSLSLRPRVQIRDTVGMQGGQPSTNEIQVHTMRLWLQGFVLTRDLQYGIQLAFGGNDFEAGSSSPIFDAYVDYLRLRDLNIRVGQFFVPFDRSRTIREFGLQFVDRAQLISELSLDRDVGLSLSSSNLGGFHGIFGYALGVFGGDGKNRFGGMPIGFLYTGRLIVRPFGPFDDDLEGDLLRLRRPRLAIGVAGAYNQNTARQKSTTGTTLTLGVIDYIHADADLVFKLAGFSLIAEVLMRKAREGSFVGMVNGSETRQWSRSAIGYIVQAGMMVHRLVEITARYDDLRAIGNTDPTLIAMASKTGKEINAGANLYLNGHAFKLQTDYVYLFGSQLQHGHHGVRIQLDASF